MARANDLSVGRNTGEVLRVLAGLQCGELCPANWRPGQATIPRPKDTAKAAPWETRSVLPFADPSRIQ